MKNVLFTLVLLPFINSMSQSFVDLPVWPTGPLQNNGITENEITTKEGYIQNSKEARLYVYLPSKNEDNRKVVLICPGGGYRNLAINHEGHDVAKWFVSQGVVAVILKYRMPNHHSDIPLSDAKEAMKIIRRHSVDWNIDTTKVGVCGFSAGGHLASTLSTHADDATRPNFSILFYPVISLKDSICHRGSRDALLDKNDDIAQINYFSNETQVTDKTPPTLFILADNDKAVVPENSILFYQALKKHQIAASMHIFPKGGHGFGFRSSYPYHEQIKLIISDWMK